LTDAHRKGLIYRTPTGTFIDSIDDVVYDFISTDGKLGIAPELLKEQLLFFNQERITNPKASYPSIYIEKGKQTDSTVSQDHLRSASFQS
jgi:hypothetical protein